MLVVGCIAAPSALAAAELTVSPLIIEVNAKSGETIRQTIVAEASGDEPLTVEFVHADFGFGEDYSPVLIRDDAAETTAFSTRDWFSMPRPRYRIRAGQSLSLPLRIDVPENTPGGTYLGAALLRVVPPDVTDGGSQVQAVPETGPLLFIAVDGGEPPEAAMRRFDVPRMVGTGPFRPKLVVENIGDEFFTYEGTVKLTGPGKDETVEVGRQFVVPGEPRTVRTSASEKGSDGRIELGSRKLGFGQYRITTRLKIQPVGTTLVASRTIWIVPMWARFVAALLAIAFLVSVGFLARWVSHQRDANRFLREAAAADSEREPYGIDDEPEDELEDQDEDDELSDDDEPSLDDEPSVDDEPSDDVGDVEDDDDLR